jgi:polyvinyl alcohol dehydrogenase (cytochrome)
MRFGRAARILIVANAWLSAVLAGQPVADKAVSGAAVFDMRCKSCHEPAIERAPNRVDLSFRSRDSIVSALTTGVMAPLTNGLSREEVQAVAVFLQPSEVLRSAGLDKMCTTHEPMRASASDWASMGIDDSASRFQREPELRAQDVPKLRVKWAFAMPGGGQATVVGKWLFMNNRGGKLYALDAKTGCVHWAVDGAGSRTTPMVVRSPMSPSGWATIVGIDIRRVRAFDAQTGQELWTSQPLDLHGGAFINGSPVVSGNQIFVPISSGEEVLAIANGYPCCSFRGSLVALDLQTGRKLWQTFMITEPLRSTRINAAKVQMQGPAGAPVWAAPSTDPERGLVYVATGNSYTDVPTDTTDAIVALDMKTGSMRWKYQATVDDNYIQGCSGPIKASNCTLPTGPDFDFGATPILFGKRGGPQVLIAAQKSGAVYGLDPDTGALRWRTVVGEGSPLGGIEWGIAADDRYVFVPVSDVGELFDEVFRAAGVPPMLGYQTPGKPGLFALDPFTGKILWNVPAPIAACKYAGDRSGDFTKGACVRAQSAAPGVMPGVVFSGTLDGWLRAYEAATGKIIWAFSTTAQTYITVNAVADQPGGGIDGMGPTIAGGMLYAMSGFNGASRTGGNGVNVLLAFSVDGR